MDAFIQKFCEKYSLPIALSLQLLDNMEKFTFRKGDFLVQEGGRNSNFYIVSKGIWRGHYLNDGVDVSVWFASEGEAIFSSWGYVENTVSLVSIEAMCDSELYGISKAKLEVLYAGSVELANFGRRLFEQQFLGLESWMITGGSPRAKERYLTLLEENPELLQYVCTSEAYRFLFMDYSTVVKPYPCRTGEKEKRPMTILAFTGLVLSYGNALFSLLFLVWFIFALMDGRKVGIR